MKIYYVLAVLACALLTSNVWAAEPKGNSVYLVPSWISNKNPASDFSCSRGQSRYRQHLLYMALEGGRLAKSKSNYYNLATFLGYFADNPVAKDEIVTQVQATIDKDVAAMDALVAKRPYFLFVGDYGSSQEEWHILFRISMPEGPYDWNGDKVHSDKYAYNWEKNSFPVSAYGPGGSLRTDIVTSSKEWKDKWQDIFQYAGDSLASRLLLDNKMNPVLAEIFDKESGKTVLSWAAPGVNQQKLQALIPETPASEYNFENCDSLNPDYYKNPNAAERAGGVIDGLNQKIDNINKRGGINFKFW